jgi:hypothetical protein
MKGLDGLAVTAAEVSNISSARRRLTLLKQIGGQHAPITISREFFAERAVSLATFAQAEQLMLTIDIRAEAAKRVKLTHQDEFLFELFDSLKSRYGTMRDQEKHAIYDIIKAMCDLALAY